MLKQEHIQPREMRFACAQSVHVLLVYVPADRWQWRVHGVPDAERRPSVAEEPRGGCVLTLSELG